MTDIRFPQRLTVGSWEAALASRSGPDLDSWLRSGGEQLHLNFTRVEWIDFGVLARALLLLDAAVTAGVGAVVTLPARDRTRLENRVMERQSGESGGQAQTSMERQLRRRASRRGQALAFMRQAGFMKAIATADWPGDSVHIRSTETQPTDRPVEESHSPIPAVDGDDQATPGDVRRRRLLPLQWLVPMQGRSLRESASFLSLETGLRDLGMAASDARAISQTILAELIENVAQHAGPESATAPNALVGAMLLDPAGFAAQRDNLLSRADGLFDSVDAGSGRVLRLLVGDCGPADLDAATETRAGAIADALTASSETGPQDGIRGFRRVARVVQSYRGCVTVRAGDRSVGLVFDNGTDHAGRFEAGLARIPGSLVEAAVLTDPPLTAPVTRWHAHPATHQSHRLLWTGCTLDPVFGLRHDDRERVESRIEQARSGTETIGVVVTVPACNESPVVTGTMQRALQRTLATLSRHAENAAVAVVFPDISRHLLDLHMTDLYAEGEPDADDGPQPGPRRPLLVFGSHGLPLWCGGSAPLRAMLAALTEADGMLPIDEAEQRWLDAHGSRETFAEALRDEKHLFVLEQGSLLLCLSPAVVLASLRDTAQHALASEVERSGEGVHSGAFRTPMLGLTSRWIDIAQLVRGTLGTEIAAFTLARAAEAELAEVPSAVAQADTCPPDLTARLSECLAQSAFFFPMASELDQDGWPAPDEVPDNARVVLCADLISTENTVRRAAATIAEHATLVAIVCVIDARTDRGPIRVLNRDIPIISLASVDIELDPATNPDAPIVDIDPILRRPVSPPAAPPQRHPVDPMDENTLFELCAPDSGAESGALRLGHFKRPRRVHYSAIIQLSRLFRRPDAREQITAVTTKTVVAALDALDRDHGPVQGDDAITIWYPGTPTDNAGLLAHAVGERLTAIGQPVDSLVAVGRTVAGTVWHTLPVTPDPDNRPKRVVIIESGILTGATATQLIQDAVRCGAERIAVVALLNLLPSHDAGMLGLVSAVRGDIRDGSGRAGSGTPVIVRFVTDTSVGGLDALDCPVCATRRKYLDLGHVPKRLGEHADVLRELLRPRNLDEIFQTVATDLFNVPVARDDAADYLRWRGLLHRALRSTADRQSVLDLLTVLAEDTGDRPWSARGLIRLLAAEQHWFKLPPLRFAAARALLADICRNELDTSAPGFPWLRVQALMVLSSAAPDRFVGQLPALLASSADEPLVADQLFLDCYRLVRRPSHDSPVDHQELRTSLTACRDYLERSQADWDHQLIDDLLNVVRQLISLAERPQRPRTGNVQSAWAELREDWCRWVERHHFSSSARRVRDFVEDLESDPLTRKRARAAEEDWEICARRVNERVLPILPELREILTGEYVGDVVGPSDQERLIELSRTGTIGLSMMTEKLHELTRATWEPRTKTWQDMWEDVLDRSNFWHRMFFATHRPNSESPSLLVELIRSAPVSIHEVVEAVINDLRLNSAVVQADDLDIQVFCPKGLLKDVVEHVLENAPRHRHGEDEQKFEIVLRRHDLESVNFAIRNTATRPSPSPGRGMEELDRSLRPFGGSLIGNPLSDNGWTFEAIITLQPWRGA